MPNPAQTPGVASLWIGGALGWIEALCLDSFLKRGQPVTLFTYAPVGNVPAGVDVRDARDVWVPPRDLLQQTAASYIADIFRIHLMLQTDLIWVDCDAFCLKPFIPDPEGYLIGHYHGRTEIANGVMRLPKTSAALKFMSEIWNDPEFIPPWIRPALQQRIRNTSKSERLVKKFHVKRTIIGPRALTYGLKESGEISHALHERVLYPVPWEFTDLFFNPHGGVEGWMADDTISVHLYGSQIKSHHKKNPPHPDSFIARQRVQSPLSAPATVKPLMPEAPIKILGERNCGTNLLSQSIERSWPGRLAQNAPGLTKQEMNAIRHAQPDRGRRSELREAILDQKHADTLADRGGWKHSAATEKLLNSYILDKGAAIICLVRHPVSWARSMQRNPFHSLSAVPQDFSQFLRTPWVTRGRDELGARLFRSPLEMYARKVESFVWLTRQWSHSKIMRYEDIVTDPDSASTNLAEFLGSPKQSFELSQTNAREFLSSERTLDDYRARASADPMVELSPEDREIILELLSGSLLSDLYALGEDSAGIGTLKTRQTESPSPATQT